MIFYLMSLTKFTNTEILVNSSNELKKVVKKQKNHIKELVESEEYQQLPAVDKRNKFQYSIRKTWRTYDYIGMFIISMGVGKSKIIAKSINDYKKHFTNTTSDLEILILVNSSTLRDTGLPNELVKWGAIGGKSVKIECYQWLLHNKEIFKSNIGLLICDEIDVALSPAFGKAVNKLKAECKLFLTGTLSDAKRELLKQFKNFPPILYEYGIQKAQQDGLINKMKILLHEVPLDIRKNVTFEVQGKKFVKSEKDRKSVV